MNEDTAFIGILRWLHLTAIPELGPLPLFVVLLSPVCAFWLMIRRMRGCFSHRSPNMERDLVLFLGGPISTLLVFFAILGVHLAPSVVEEGFQPDWPELGREISAIAVMGLLSFLWSLGAMLLPQKSAAHLPPIKTQPEEPS